MRVVLAEKPSVARDLAAILKATARKNGYLEGNGWAVTWALGHLVELKEPHEYHAEWKRWRVEDLPLLPEKFALRPRGDQGARNQLNVVRDLFKQADSIVCATDAGREGELIFRYIQQWATATRVPFQRLWIHSLTEEAIRKGFEALQDGHAFDNLYQAARCRSEADWIIGLNATRYFTASFGGHGVLWSVGRVQTPVLALIAERDLEIETFKPEPYWRVITQYRDTRFTHTKAKFTSESEAADLVDRLRPHLLVVEDVEEKEQRTPPPQLYDLSSLQQDMNTWFGFTADQTLSLAQGLYESKHLTYPRTDSRHIGKDIAEQLPDLLRALPDEYQTFVSQLDLAKLNPGKRMVDDSKVTDHHAILPTQVIPRGLSGPESKVYAAVVRRLLAGLFPYCRKMVTTVKATVDREPFQAKGTVPVDWGWQVLYPHLQKDKQQKPDDEDPDQVMPEMKKGEEGPHEPGLLSKTTTPPKRFTEATLLKRMETAGRLVDDEALREAMKQRGLGTPATRAAIIETLLSRKYIRRQKKALISTEAGRHLLHLIRDPSLRSAELTGDWEAKLKDIEQGKGDPDSFMQGIREHAAAIVQVEASPDADHGGLGNCPHCGSPVIEGKKGYGCSKWKDGCKFVLWKEQHGTTLDTGLARELLDLGHTLMPLPVRIEDQPALAVLKLDIKGDVVLEPVKTKSAEGKGLGPCPLCGGTVMPGKKGYGCSNWKQGCPFVIWKTIAKRNITQGMVKQLLENGRTEQVEGFTSRAGKPFSAVLKLENGKAVFDFNA